jgi:hypothetical protein
MTRFKLNRMNQPTCGPQHNGVPQKAQGPEAVFRLILIVLLVAR